MEKIMIPPDIKKVIRINAFKEFWNFFFTTIVFLLVGLALGFMFFKHFPQIVKYIAFGIWMMIPIYKTKFPFKLFQKSWRGEVTKVEIHTSKVQKLLYAPYKLINVTNLTVLKDNGKIIVKKALEKNARHELNLNFFSEGDKVIFIKGTKYVQRVPRLPKESINCVICGCVQQQNNAYCTYCQHTLHFIQPKY